MKWILIFLFSARVCLAYTANDGAKTVATDGSASDVQGAITYATNKLQDGWVITVGSASGNYTWTTVVVIDSLNTLTVQGADTNNRPTITFGNGSPATSIIVRRGTNGKIVTLQNMMWTDASSGGPTAAWIGIDGDGVCFRITNVKFTNGHANFCGLVGSLNSDNNAGPFGLIDHCEFNATGTGFAGFDLRYNGGNSSPAYGWTQPMTWGTTNQVVFEDCIAHAVTTFAGAGLFDGDNGFRTTIRYCNLTNYTTVVHGPDSGGLTHSGLSVESYKNIFYSDQTASGQAYQQYFRGGTGYIYSNQVYQAVGGTVYNTIWWLTVDCASTTVWNTEGCPRQYLYPADYPVVQQVGRGVVAGADSPVPFFFWSNTVPATVFGTVLGGHDSGDAPFIVSGREYFLNTQATNYTALVYPHPLIGQSSPTPSTYIATIGTAVIGKGNSQ